MFVSRALNNFKKKFLFIHLSVCIQEWVFDTTMIFCDSFCNRTLGVSPVFNYELEIHGIINSPANVSKSHLK